MKILKALKPIFHNGQVIEEGEPLSCSEAFATMLIENESAELIEITQNENSEDALTEIDERRKELKELTVKELVALTKEKGIEGFTDKSKKDDIIDALLVNK